MTMVKRGNQYVISENHREIDILLDFYTVQQECRESYYYLNSIEIQLKNHPWVAEKIDEATVSDFFKKINDLQQQFISLEQIGLGKSQSAPSVSDDITPFFTTRGMNLSEVIDSIKQAVELKSKIDKIQIEILETMIDNIAWLGDEIAKSNEQLTMVNAHTRLSIGMSMSFNHSVDEDKVVTHDLVCKQKEIIKEFKKQKIDLPITFKIRDYSYNLATARKHFQMCYSSFIKLLELLPQVELNEKQASYNKQVTWLTYLITGLTIATIIIGGLGLYLDHFKKDTEKKSESLRETVYIDTYELKKK